MDRREKILDFIRQYIQQHGYPPTLREIGYGCSVSSSSVVTHHLRRLERDGLIERSADGESRGIRLSGARFVVPGDTVEVEIRGRVRVGKFLTRSDVGARRGGTKTV